MAVVCQHLCHRGTESAIDGVLLSRDNGTAVFCCRANGFLIQRLNRVHVHDPHLNALCRQRFRRMKCLRNLNSAGDNGGIFALSQDDGLAHLKRRFRRGHNLCCQTAGPQRDRSVDFSRRIDSLLHLAGIAGNENDHVGQRTHESNILNCLMAASVLTDAQAGMGQAQLDVCLGIADGVPDLLKGASRTKYRKGAGKDGIAAVCQSGTGCHHVRLGNTEIVELIRMCRCKKFRHGRLRQVRITDDDIGICITEFFQCLAIRSTCRFKLCHSYTPRSAFTILYSSSLKALPCHAT